MGDLCIPANTWKMSTLLLLLSATLGVASGSWWQCGGTTVTNCTYNGQVIADLSPGQQKRKDCSSVYHCNSNGEVCLINDPVRCSIPLCVNYTEPTGSQCCAYCEDGHSCQAPSGKAIDEGTSAVDGDNICWCLISACYQPTYTYGSTFEVPRASCQPACQTPAHWNVTGLRPGGSWTSDDYCLNCSCSDEGLARCMNTTCGEPGCDDYTYEEGQCCPVCPFVCRLSSGTKIAPNESVIEDGYICTCTQICPSRLSMSCRPAVCSLDDGTTLSLGQSKDQGCDACQCRQIDNEVKLECNPRPCPEPDCDDYYTPSGDCCPVCPERKCKSPGGSEIEEGASIIEGDKNCTCTVTILDNRPSPSQLPDAFCIPRGCSLENGTIIEGENPGDTFFLDVCTRCSCDEDYDVTCSAVICPTPLCSDAVVPDNECCPKCPRGSNCKTSNGTIIPAGGKTVVDTGTACYCSLSPYSQDAVCEEVCTMDGELVDKSRGDRWPLNDLKCLCKSDGAVECKVCEENPCLEPVYVDDQVCKRCVKGLNCLVSSTNKVINGSDPVVVGVGKACSCIASPYSREAYCEDVCTLGDVIVDHQLRERWEDDGEKCLCTSSGNVLCSICPLATCVQPQYRQDQVCDICVNGSNCRDPTTGAIIAAGGMVVVDVGKACQCNLEPYSRDAECQDVCTMDGVLVDKARGDRWIDDGKACLCKANGDVICDQCEENKCTAPTFVPGKACKECTEGPDCNLPTSGTIKAGVTQVVGVGRACECQLTPYLVDAVCEDVCTSNNTIVERERGDRWTSDGQSCLCKPNGEVICDTCGETKCVEPTYADDNQACKSCIFGSNCNLPNATVIDAGNLVVAGVGKACECQLEPYSQDAVCQPVCTLNFQIVPNKGRNERWMQGDQFCLCMASGAVLCQLCPAPECVEPQFESGEVCKQCVNGSDCKLSSGERIKAGENVLVDVGTQCYCNTTHYSEDAVCESVCSKDGVVQEGRERNDRWEDGDDSCLCRSDGDVECKPCEENKCVNPVHVDGKVCKECTTGPTCKLPNGTVVGAVSPMVTDVGTACTCQLSPYSEDAVCETVCIRDGVILQRSLSQRWTEGNTTCLCQANGVVDCEDCDPPTCYEPVYETGKVCKQCPEGSNCRVSSTGKTIPAGERRVTRVGEACECVLSPYSRDAECENICTRDGQEVDRKRRDWWQNGTETCLCLAMTGEVKCEACNAPKCYDASRQTDDVCQYCPKGPNCKLPNGDILEGDGVIVTAVGVACHCNFTQYSVDAICEPVCTRDMALEPGRSRDDRWEDDNGETCLCAASDGEVTCKQCLPPKCVDAELQSGYICDQCPSGENCRLPNGEIIEGNKTVVEDVGRACHCNLDDYSEDAECEDVCTLNGVIQEGRVRGDRWTQGNESFLCKEDDGSVLSQICPAVICVDSVRPSDQVCDECPNGSNCKLPNDTIIPGGGELLVAVGLACNCILAPYSETASCRPVCSMDGIILFKERGDRWQQDDDTCLCRDNGGVECETCDENPCVDEEYVDGQICQQCPTGSNCKLNNGTIINAGEDVVIDEGTACHCDLDEYSENAVCVPVCTMDFVIVNRSRNERWQLGDQSCLCTYGGRVDCEVCEDPTCVSPQYVSGEVCRRCVNGSNCNVPDTGVTIPADGPVVVDVGKVCECSLSPYSSEAVCSTVCTYQGLMLSNRSLNERWTDGEHTCLCKENGEVECKLCFETTCVDAVYKDGEVCEECPDGSNCLLPNNETMKAGSRNAFGIGRACECQLSPYQRDAVCEDACTRGDVIVDMERGERWTEFGVSCLCRSDGDVKCEMCNDTKCVEPVFADENQVCESCPEGPDCKLANGTVIAAGQDVVTAVGKACRCSVEPYNQDAVCRPVCTLNFQILENREHSERWSQGDESCLCTGGGAVLCQECPTPPCLEPEFENGKVCKQCVNGSDCKLSTGERIKAGQNVLVDVGTQCYCNTTHYSVDAVCESVCSMDGVVQEGRERNDRWKDGDDSCLCRSDGEVECKPCEVPKCVNPVYEDDKVCQQCLEGLNCRLTNGTVIRAGGRIVTDVGTACQCNLSPYSQDAECNEVCTMNGVLVEKSRGERWANGDETCMCMGDGNVQCVLCTNPTCVEPEYVAGQVCQQCVNGSNCRIASNAKIIPAGVDVVPSVGIICRCTFSPYSRSAVCQPGCTRDNQVVDRRRGEEWQSGTETCVCWSCTGEVKCEVCGVPKCVDSTRGYGQICASCPRGHNCRLESGELISAGGYVVVAVGKVCRCTLTPYSQEAQCELTCTRDNVHEPGRKRGDEWPEGDRTCRCSQCNGAVTCRICPPPKCVNAVVPQGQVCRACPCGFNCRVPGLDRIIRSVSFAYVGSGKACRCKYNPYSPQAECINVCAYRGRYLPARKRGQVWTVGCHTCYCNVHTGEVTCQRCPAPNCVDSRHEAGRVCRTCPNGGNCRIPATKEVIGFGQQKVIYGGRVCRCIPTPYRQWAICRPACVYNGRVVPGKARGARWVDGNSSCVCSRCTGLVQCQSCPLPSCVNPVMGQGQNCRQCPCGLNCRDSRGHIIRGAGDTVVGVGRVCRCQQRPYSPQAVCRPVCTYQGRHLPGKTRGQIWAYREYTCRCMPDTGNVVCARCRRAKCVDSVLNPGKACRECPHGENCYVTHNGHRFKLPYGIRKRISCYLCFCTDNSEQATCQNIGEPASSSSESSSQSSSSSSSRSCSVGGSSSSQSCS